MAVSQPTATRYDCQSMVELPGAPPQPWIVRNDREPGGQGRQAQDRQRAAEERTQPVGLHAARLPRRTASRMRCWSLFDESAYLNNVPTPVILDNLIAAGKIPPMVAVLIANPSQDTRNKELPPNPAVRRFPGDRSCCPGSTRATP